MAEVKLTLSEYEAGLTRIALHHWWATIHGEAIKTESKDLFAASETLCEIIKKMGPQ